jgi:hypothetical protein
MVGIERGQQTLALFVVAWQKANGQLTAGFSRVFWLDVHAKRYGVPAIHGDQYHQDESTSEREEFDQATLPLLLPRQVPFAFYLIRCLLKRTGRASSFTGFATPAPAY